MAKIKLGATIGDARNAVGGIVYSKNRFGAYLRSKVSPVQPRTSSVLNQRSSFSQFAKRWGSELDDEQRAGWIALAALYPRTDVFGDSQVLTGLQLYVSCNRNLSLVDQPIVDDPPADLSVESLTSLVGTADSDPESFSIAFAPAPLPAATYMQIDASPLLPASRAFLSGSMRFIQKVNTGTNTPIDLLAAYKLVHGSLIATRKVLVRAYLINNANGAASAPLTDVVTVA